MDLTYDPEKERTNLRTHRISLARFAEMDFAQARIAMDRRNDYGEDRWIIVAPLAGRVHVAVVTYRAGAPRVISLRRANRREQRGFAHATTNE